MDPKEKALDLIDKFIEASAVKEEKIYYHQKPYSLAKQCAIIAVDEILKIADIPYSKIHYWSLVKTEIEKL